MKVMMLSKQLECSRVEKHLYEEKLIYIFIFYSFNNLFSFAFKE